MKKIFITALSVLAMSATAFAATSTSKAIKVHGNTMAEVEQKVATEIAKMKKGDYKHQTMGSSCDEARPYKVTFTDGSASFGVGADGSLTPKRPGAWIKFTCKNYSKED
jgi:hypothetical protein